MISYPSILYPRAIKNLPNIPFHIFEKLDGSNLRFEYNEKKGFFKVGSRTQLISGEEEQFEGCLNLFEQFSDTLIQIFREQKWRKATVFCEYYGENSFFGHHLKDDPKNLKLIDVHVFNKGFLDPDEYLKIFQDKVPSAKYLGSHFLTESFLQSIYESKLEGMSREGIIGKKLYNQKLYRFKVKTDSYREKLLSQHILED